MENYTACMKNYWNTRFSQEKKIWGDSPSKTATHALDFFSKSNVAKILIPGIGYGRNSKLFSSNGILTDGIEISKKAIEIGRTYDPSSTFFQGSVINNHMIKHNYDGIYCFNVLHLFRENERYQLINICFNALKTSGVAYFVVFSEQEKSFGIGNSVEPNTFESKPDRPVHYFTDTDIKNHFKQFNIIDTGIIEDYENHGGNFHTHVLRYIFAQKK